MNIETIVPALKSATIADDSLDGDIEFSTSQPLWGDFEDEEGVTDPSAMAHDITGCISVDGEDAGELEAVLIDLARGVNEGFSPFTVLDSIDASVYEAGSAIYTPDGVTVTAERLFPHSAFTVRLLILQKITIKPKYRGKELGLKAARAAIRVYASHDSIILFKPFPLQYEEGGSDEVHTQGDFDLDTRKLKDYWMRLGGFKAIGKTGYLGRDMQMVVKRAKTRKAVV